ncbi:unannotated protein [freshwater metagenome]|uniref:Unannotated protein n=1 Tax=freshwater metagenome TaxID=449393 RepID=A0A6J6QJQ4_9ZZZZ
MNHVAHYAAVAVQHGCSLRDATNAVAAHLGKRAVGVIEAHRNSVFGNAPEQQQTVGANV